MMTLIMHTGNILSDEKKKKSKEEKEKNRDARTKSGENSCTSILVKADLIRAVSILFKSLLINQVSVLLF